MPSPNPQLSPTTTPSPQEKPSNPPSTNGINRATKDEVRNGFEPNGLPPPAQSPEPIQERKQKAKAVMAASALSAPPDGAVTVDNSDVANGSGTISNGMVQTRKRSRSGTRIIRSPKCRNNDRILKPRGPNDANAEGLEKVELHQYVDRALIHTDARMYEGIEMDKLHDFKRDEADFYMALRGLDANQVREGKRAYQDLHKEARPKWLDPPVTNLSNPSAIYGPGYGQYGKFGNGINQGKPMTLIYPAQRKRAGGKKTRELRVPRKELGKQSEQLDELVPIRLDIEWDKIRLRDTFTWNLHDRVTPPDLFAQQLVEDFKLPLEQCGPLLQQVSASIKEQIQDYHPHIFIEEEALDPHLPYNAYKDDEMRITIKLNITIGQHTLVDQFEWEINNPLNSAEIFAEQMTRDLSLAGEFTTAIAHSIREQSQLFTRGLFVTGHPFDGRPVEDQELKAGFLPSPMPSPFRPYQAAKEFTPYLYELNELELEKTELSLSREERRQKRSVNRRGGPALPDLKDRRRTIRTLVVSSVLPGAAETLEDSMIFKRTAAVSGKGRRPGYGQKDGLEDTDESESEESAPDSPAIPAHLLAGTARTRGMRGAATVAQAAMRGALGRSATPETTLHHHETRTSGRRFGGKDYREESVDDSQPSLIVKLRIHRDRLRQFLRDQKGRSKPTSLEQPSHRRASSATPGRSTPAPGAMGPPTTPSVQQHQQTRQHGSPAEQRDGVNPLHPHAAQIGRVDAVGPPTPENPMPDPPSWLHQALSKLQITYPDDLFEGTMRYTAVSTITDLPISLRPSEPSPPDTKFMYYPRIKCLDCPGKLYTPGPETGVNNFEVHLKNRIHREKVERRIREGGGRSAGPEEQRVEGRRLRTYLTSPDLGTDLQPSVNNPPVSSSTPSRSSLMMRINDHDESNPLLLSASSNPTVGQHNGEHGPDFCASFNSQRVRDKSTPPPFSSNLVYPATEESHGRSPSLSSTPEGTSPEIQHGFEHHSAFDFVMQQGEIQQLRPFWLSDPSHSSIILRRTAQAASPIPSRQSSSQREMQTLDSRTIQKFVSKLGLDEQRSGILCNIIIASAPFYNMESPPIHQVSDEIESEDDALREALSSLIFLPKSPIPTTAAEGFPAGSSTENATGELFLNTNAVDALGSRLIEPRSDSPPLLWSTAVVEESLDPNAEDPTYFTVAEFVNTIIEQGIQVKSVTDEDWCIEELREAILNHLIDHASKDVTAEGDSEEEAFSAEESFEHVKIKEDVALSDLSVEPDSNEPDAARAEVSETIERGKDTSKADLQRCKELSLNGQSEEDDEDDMDEEEVDEACARWDAMVRKARSEKAVLPLD